MQILEIEYVITKFRVDTWEKLNICANYEVETGC